MSWLGSLLDVLGYDVASTGTLPPPSPDVFLAVDEPGATISLSRRKTNLSRRVRLEVWANANVQLILNGQQVTT